MFTVLMCVYNVETYLSRCLNSIVNQSIGFKDNITIIAVDDGSTDNSASILKKYSVIYPDNIFLYQKDNGGVASARNFALKKAEQKNAEWITFIDPDDYVLPNYFELVKDSINNDKNLIALLCNSWSLDETTNKLDKNGYLGFQHKGSPKYSIDNLDNKINYHLNKTFLKLSRILKYNLTFIENIPIFEGCYFYVNYIIADNEGLIQYLEKPIYVLVSRKTKNSLTQIKYSKKESFLNLFNYGYLNLLKTTKSKLGFVPRWVQFTVLYDVLYFLRDLRNKDITILNDDEKKEHFKYLEEIVSYIDETVIRDWDLNFYYVLKVFLLGLKNIKFGSNNVKEFIYVKNIDNQTFELSFFYFLPTNYDILFDGKSNSNKVQITADEVFVDTYANLTIINVRKVKMKIRSAVNLRVLSDNRETILILLSERDNWKVTQSVGSLVLRPLYTTMYSYSDLMYKFQRAVVFEDIQIQDYDEVYVLPLIENKVIGRGRYLGGVFDKNNKFVAGFNGNHRDISKDPGVYGVLGYYNYDGNIISIDEDVIFGGVLIGHFGHFLLESMPRLWYIVENPQDTRKIVFIIHPIEGGYKKWFESFLELLDIPLSRCIFVEREALKFSHMTIPEESIHSWYGYNEKYLVPYQKIISNCPKSNIKKIYFSRGKFKEAGTLCIGEEIFEDFYRKQGFEIVYPESLPLKEQISLVAGAEHFVCTKGSLSHFMVFLPPNAKVDFLYRSTNGSNFSIYLQLKACQITNFNIIDTCYNLFWQYRNKGAALLGITKHFCEYAKNEFGVDLKPEFPTKYVTKYIEEQINFLVNKRFDYVANWTSVDWLNQLHLGFYGEELSSAKKSELLSKLPKTQNNKIDNFKYDLNKKQHFKSFIISLHIANIGWIEGLYAHEKTNNSTVNHIEALRLNSQEKLNFEYCTEYGGTWGEKVESGEISGTVGKSTAITGFALYLAEETAQKYEIFYRLADKNGKWSNWTHDGQKISINTPVVDIAFKIVGR